MNLPSGRKEKNHRWADQFSRFKYNFSGGFEKSRPPFSFFKNENTGGVLKSPFFKDTAVSRRSRRVYFLLRLA